MTPQHPSAAGEDLTGALQHKAIRADDSGVISVGSSVGRGASPIVADYDMSFGAAALMELAQGAGRTPRPGAQSPPPQDTAPPAVAPLSQTKAVAEHAPPTRRSKPSHAPPGSEGGGARRAPSPTPRAASVNGGAAAEVHVVLPRRKAGELDAPERDAVVVTPEVLASLFHCPLAVASRKLGLSATTIKKLCRKLGINKWPYKSPFRTPRAAAPPARAGRKVPEKRRASAGGGGGRR